MAGGLADARPRDNARKPPEMLGCEDIGVNIRDLNRHGRLDKRIRDNGQLWLICHASPSAHERAAAGWDFALFSCDAGTGTGFGRARPARSDGRPSRCAAGRKRRAACADRGDARRNFGRGVGTGCDSARGRARCDHAGQDPGFNAGRRRPNRLCRPGRCRDRNRRSARAAGGGVGEFRRHQRRLCLSHARSCREREHEAAGPAGRAAIGRADRPGHAVGWDHGDRQLSVGLGGRQVRLPHAPSDECQPTGRQCLRGGAALRQSRADCPAYAQPHGLCRIPLRPGAELRSGDHHGTCAQPDSAAAWLGNVRQSG